MERGNKKLAEYVAEHLTSILHEKGYKKGELAENLYLEMGFITSGSAKELFSNLFNGSFWTWKKPGTEMGKKTADRISLLLNALDIGETSEIVSKLRGFYGEDFVYPIKRTSNTEKILELKFSRVLGAINDLESYVIKTTDANPNKNDFLENAKQNIFNYKELIQSSPKNDS